MHNSLSLLMRSRLLFSLWLFSVSLLVSACVSPPRPAQPPSSPASMAAPLPPPPPALAAPLPPGSPPLAEESLLTNNGTVADPSAFPPSQPSVASTDQPHTILAGPEYGQVDHVVKTVGTGALPQISVVGIKQSDSEDGQNVLIEGTLRNQGAVPTRWVKVKIEAQDETGRAITTMSPQPTSQVIPPGGSATFAAQLANDPAVRKFFIKADFR